MSLLVDTRHIHTLKNDFTGICLFVGIIWLVFLLDQFIPFLPFERLGLVPREMRGLDGILTMPFLHKDFSHLLSNTVPLIITLLLLTGSRANSTFIVVATVLLGGALLWVFGREARHIGASGLVFGLIAFHIAFGFFEKRLRSIAIAIVVGLLYSSTLLQGILPLQSGVSWDGHLLGAVAGGLIAFAVAQDPGTTSSTGSRGSSRSV